MQFQISKIVTWFIPPNEFRKPNIIHSLSLSVHVSQKSRFIKTKYYKILHFINFEW